MHGEKPVEVPDKQQRVVQNIQNKIKNIGKNALFTNPLLGDIILVENMKSITYKDDFMQKSF